MKKYADLLKIHLYKDQNLAWCSKIITPVMLGTNFLLETTCKTCIDKYKFDHGKLSEWRLGGNYDKNGKIRKKVN